MIPTWQWQLDGWIVAAGVLCALSCALLGNFLLLRRMSMMGDAISHAVLPGLAAAFILTGSRGSLTMLIGAAAVGVLTAVFTETLTRLGKVDEGASMGVVFTALFALGLILIRRAADHVDLDPGCVLYGMIESAWSDPRTVGPFAIPRVVLVLGVMLMINVAFVALFYKELKLSSFDPALATSLGINATLMHYLLMTMVAITTVASFEAVGSILVVAMLIVPPAAAYLLTDRLGAMILVSLILAGLSGALGHLAAIQVPRWFGFGSTHTAGMMATIAGFGFLLVLLLAPRHGVVSKLLTRASLSMRIVAEDILGVLYRVEELSRSAGHAAPRAVDHEVMRRLLGTAPWQTRLAVQWLRLMGLAAPAPQGWVLTPAGRQQARQLLRSHRLWENYLVREVELAADHSHAAATQLEHVTSAAMQRRLSEALDHPAADPQGKPIPGEEVR